MVNDYYLLYLMLISLNGMLQRVLTSSDMNGKYKYKEIGCYRPHSEEMGKVLFSQLSVCPHFGGGGTPSQWGRGLPPSFPTQGGTPSQVRPEVGVPPSKVKRGVPSGQDREGYPHPSSGRKGTPNRNSTACTCYAVGGLTLAFTQEDFFVYLCRLTCIWTCGK